MKELLEKLFSSDFMLHGYCYLWKPGLGSTRSKKANECEDRWHITDGAEKMAYTLKQRSSPVRIGKCQRARVSTIGEIPEAR